MTRISNRSSHPGANPDPDQFFSIHSGPETEQKVKGSRFIGQALFVDSVADTQSELVAIRRRYHDATHHCCAYRLSPPESPLERSDDDGEPSGTAGLPILGAILRRGVLDVLVVVTRYYGGTKLGTGGLVRAYGESARASLEAAQSKTIIRVVDMVVGCAYEDVGILEATLSRAGADLRAISREFAERPRFKLVVKPSAVESLSAALIEATGGRATIERGGP